MSTAKTITQKDIEQVSSNSMSDVGNKIKLRSISMANLLQHITNIPIYEANKTKRFTFIPTIDMQLNYGKSKAINTKESMVENIIKHRLIDKPQAINGEEIALNNQPLAPEITVENETKSENYDLQKDNVTNTNTTGFDDYITEIKTVTESVQEVKFKAEQAEAEASKSSETLNQLGIEETEVAKSLEDAKIRKQELEKAVIMAFSNQKDTLTKNRKKYEDLILEANKRKEENQNKIAQFQTKIEQNKQVLTDTENEIAKLQEIYNAVNSGDSLSEYNIVSFNSQEEPIKAMRSA